MARESGTAGTEAEALGGSAAAGSQGPSVAGALEEVRHAKRQRDEERARAAGLQERLDRAEEARAAQEGEVRRLEVVAQVRLGRVEELEAEVAARRKELDQVEEVAAGRLRTIDGMAEEREAQSQRLQAAKVELLELEELRSEVGALRQRNGNGREAERLRQVMAQVAGSLGQLSREAEVRGDDERLVGAIGALSAEAGGQGPAEPGR